MLHFYGLPYRTDYPHQDSCIVVGLAHLYRRCFGVDRDWGFARWRSRWKYKGRNKGANLKEKYDEMIYVFWIGLFFSYLYRHKNRPP